MGTPRIHIRVEKIGRTWFTDISWNGKDWKNLWNGRSKEEAHQKGAAAVMQSRNMQLPVELPTAEKAECGLLPEFGA